MRIWSVSPYFGEQDVALIKWGEQRAQVGTFVFLEANRNHQGQPREQVGLPPELHTRPEVRYGFIDLPVDEPWAMEADHRARLISAMPDLEPDDLVIVSDLEEVLSAKWIQRFAEREFSLPAQIAFAIHPYRLDLRWKRRVEEGWCRCTVATGAQVLSDGLNGVLFGAKCLSLLERTAGWHFIYQGAPENASRSTLEGVDLFGRDRPVEDVSLRKLPVYVRQNQERFSHLLRGGEHGQQGERRDGNEEEAFEGEGGGSPAADLPRRGTLPTERHGAHHPAHGGTLHAWRGFMNASGTTLHPALFRKKPVEVEAVQWGGGEVGAHAIIDWICALGDDDEAWLTAEGILIRTLEGNMTARPGDFIIRGVKGEFYPCKPEIFHATYEAVTS